MPVPRDSVPFVGRAAELESLRNTLTDAEAGRGSVVLLAGEPGIGKTRLAEELAAIAAAGGARVLWGRCYEGEGAPAFWPWAQVLRACMGDDSPGLRRLVATGAAPELSALLPDLEEPRAAGTVPPAPDSAQARFRLFESVTSALLAVSGGPTLLVLDDLHWADTSSLLLLSFFAREIRAAPLVLLGTYRDVEVGRQHPLTATLAELSRLPHVHRLSLRGLEEVDVAGVIAAVMGGAVPAAVSAAIREETEGNPFFLVELLRLLAGQGQTVEPEALTVERVRAGVPVGVRDVIDRRLDMLSADCNRVLTAAAVAGREFRLGLLPPAAELALERVQDAIEEAETARIVAPAETPGWYRFTHALIREALYDSLPAMRRARIHLRTGEALRDLAGATPEAPLAELAHHFLRAVPAGAAETAVEYLRRAGDRAMATFAYEEAAEQYQHALDVLGVAPAPAGWERCDLHLAIGEAWMRAGHATAAQAAFTAAAGIARSARADGLPGAHQRAGEVLARAALGYGGAGVQTGIVDERLIERLEEALAALDGQESVLRVRLLARLAMELYWSEARERRIALSGEAVDLGRRVGDGAALAFALTARHLALWEPENVEERLRVGAELLTAARRAGDRDMLLQGYARRIPDLLEIGDVPAAREEAEDYSRLAEEVRRPVYRWEALRFQALMAYLHGRFDEMERTAREALALAERAQIGGADVLYVSQIQFLRREQGRLGEMETPMREVMRRYPRLATSWRIALANLYAQTGRVTEARREIDEMAASRFDAVGRSLPSIGIMALLTEAIAAAGDADAAAAAYPLLLPYADRYIVNAATPNFYGAAPHYLGMLAVAMSRYDDALAHFETALAMNTHTGVPSHIVATQVELARTLLLGARETRAAGPRRAYDLLEAALAPARGLGMIRTCVEIERLLVSRQPVVPRPVAVADEAPAVALTPREREVLGLLAGGLSNQEIADALVVTVNTVERHLVSIYGKLGVKGRSAATAYAHRQGLI